LGLDVGILEIVLRKKHCKNTGILEKCCGLEIGKLLKMLGH
jgi:hypothetical protein